MAKKAEIVIIGGSTGGIATAVTARRHNKDAHIILIRREEKALFPCGIPYIFGTLDSVEKDVIPDSFLLRRDIELIIDVATAIDKEAKKVTTIKGETIAYDKLVIATGSIPSLPPIPGINSPNVFPIMNNANLIEVIFEAIKGCQSVAIIGGGFIGVEVACELKKKGIEVTIIEMLPHCLFVAFDKDFCSQAEEELRKQGIKLLVETRVNSIETEKKRKIIQLSTGEKLEADLVIVSTGIVPNTYLAKKAGLKIGDGKGIWVDPYMRTSSPNIFAVGDCAEKFSFFTGKPVPLRLASIAATEARIAGINLFGLKRKNEGAIGVFSTLVGDLVLGAAGLTEKAAKEAGFDVIVGDAIAPDRHPATMPDRREIRAKLIFDRNTHQILGGQVSGSLTAAEMINVISTAISKKMTAEELAVLQTAAHPTFTASATVAQIATAADEAIAKG